MIPRILPTLVVCLVGASVDARDTQALPEGAPFAAYHLHQAPEPGPGILRKGDRLAICGDSITEQKMYSRIIEAYLTACLPEMQVTCRQFGWSGEQASGFLARMDNDVLRFHPTVATTCYGMNDHRYVPFTDEIGAAYRENQTAVVRRFKEAGCRVVLGSPGDIDSVPPWVKSAAGTKLDLSLSLARLRDIDIEIAEAEGVAFADVFLPMLVLGHEAKDRHGEDFMLCGKDGVHPGWAGQVVMAHAFLRALGVDGDLGTITFDEAAGAAEGSAGHEIIRAEGRSLTIRSTRYAFCTPAGDPSDDNTLAAGMALVPFDRELNRFVLRIANPTAPAYDVRWGDVTRRFPADQLAGGINLAAEFTPNPFHPAFERVWNAVGAKQDYETRQIKQLFHGPEGRVDPDITATLTEKARRPLAEAVRDAMAPVEHTLTIVPQA